MWCGRHRLMYQHAQFFLLPLTHSRTHDPRKESARIHASPKKRRGEEEEASEGKKIGAVLLLPFSLLLLLSLFSAALLDRLSKRRSGEGEGEGSERLHQFPGKKGGEEEGSADGGEGGRRRITRTNH